VGSGGRVCEASAGASAAINAVTSAAEIRVGGGGSVGSPGAESSTSVVAPTGLALCAAGAGSSGTRSVSTSGSRARTGEAALLERTGAGAARGISTVATSPTAARLTVSSLPSPVNHEPRQYSRSCTKALAVWYRFAGFLARTLLNTSRHLCGTRPFSSRLFGSIGSTWTSLYRIDVTLGPGNG
jgi:hypothetical protein